MMIAVPQIMKLQRMAGMALLGLCLAVPFGRGIMVRAAENDFRSYIVDPAHQQISLHWKDEHGQPYRTLENLKAALEAKGLEVLAMMNAGIYDRQFRPLGLHIENGRQLRQLERRHGKGNFFMKPNGVFFINDKEAAAISRTSHFKPAKNIVLATQSGPLLFDRQGINPAFAKHSKYLHYRNAIGVRKDGKVVFVMSRKPVTFWALASHMRNELNCQAGLYLDGFLSQLWIKGDGPARQLNGFVGMLAVTGKKSRPAR